VYDMYSWDQASHSGSAKPSSRSADDHAETTPAAAARAAQAVQVALDRRDNGGEASR
jgi:hypothetical protein